MLIGIPKEPAPRQTLVAGTPDTVGKLVKLGYDVCIETGAGVSADYADEAYEEAGARIVTTEEAWGADIVTCLSRPPEDKVALIKRGATLISRLNPHGDDEFFPKLADAHITALALDMVPRLSRAQALDVRSSMMNVAGNRAVIEAANTFNRMFAGQVTAAGKIPPAKVYVIGVGVAGLAAIGTAVAMGAQVSATDVRPEVADQVESLGGTFVEIPVKQESADGYAKALDEEQQKLTLAVYTEQCAENDIVITTAHVPGRKAPLLITAEAVAKMKPGSIIVDMGASRRGGNCELSVADQVVKTDNGVTIIGYTDLPARLPGQASQLFGQNIVNLFKLATKEKNGIPTWDMDDEVIRGMTVALEGQIMWPPPPVNVSVAPAATAQAPAEPEPEPEKSALQKHWWKALLAAIGVALTLGAPPEMAGHFTVFMLAVVVGFYVITNVTHSLHTPLMSETNAISGIIIVGALLQIVHFDNPLVVVLAVIAMAIASINIFGGFLVTHRMLKMFEKSSE
ncbi:Re/Si-specific NAD(P)(+) transhydrogenase subunit alpha [Slackia heliotrinireducens]|uniref:Re/Si-specific NAD(P)(+) transhydrogenase subunit alpha n=1 Tax=Slackia heliotrinireducens TaxID=84110 RepID=UPI003315643A